MLNIEDVLAGKFRIASSSSSSSEVSLPAETEVQSSPSPAFHVLEMRAFQQLVHIPIPPVLHLPVRINGTCCSAPDAPQMQPRVDNSLAIVPAQPPYLHTVVLRVWAHMQDVAQAPLQ